MECPRKAILVGGGGFFPPQNTSHFFIFFHGTQWFFSWYLLDIKGIFLKNKNKNWSKSLLSIKPEALGLYPTTKTDPSSSSLLQIFDFRESCYDPVSRKPLFIPRPPGLSKLFLPSKLFWLWHWSIWHVFFSLPTGYLLYRCHSRD